MGPQQRVLPVDVKNFPTTRGKSRWLYCRPLEVRNGGVPSVRGAVEGRVWAGVVAGLLWEAWVCLRGGWGLRGP